MHEAAIAQEICDIAMRAVEENGLERLTRIVMDVGEYSAVDRRQLAIVFDIAVRGTPLEGCRLETNILPKTLGMFVRTVEGI